MTNDMTVEFAGGATLNSVMESRASVLRRAPPWVQQLVNDRRRSATSCKPAQPPILTEAPQPIAGWIFGVAVCGVSEPAYSPNDKRTLREQFTPAAFADMVKQASSGERDIPLTYGHNGPTIVTNKGLNLLFRAHGFYGLTFTARLPDSPLNRQVLEELERGVLGVSVGYQSGEGWTVERHGLGTVRVVNRARFHHLALLRRDRGELPAYRACWASGRRGMNPGCPSAVRLAAERMAYDELLRQAKAME